MVSQKHEDHFNLELGVCNEEGEGRCDGCNAVFERGDAFITGIESCCGQCTRSLCAACIKAAYQLIIDNEEENAEEE